MDTEPTPIDRADDADLLLEALANRDAAVVARDAEIARLRAVLTQIVQAARREYGQYAGDCYWCGNSQRMGHSSRCPVTVATYALKD